MKSPAMHSAAGERERSLERKSIHLLQDSGGAISATLKQLAQE